MGTKKRRRVPSLGDQGVSCRGLDVGDAGLREDVLVVVLVLELACGFFVADHDAVIVILEGRAGAHCGDGTFDEANHSVLLTSTEGEEHDLLGVHDGANAHGDGLGRHFFNLATEEEASVVLDGLLGEHLRVGAASEGATWFVEGDVAVGTDAEELDVDTTSGGDGVFISLAGGGDVGGETVRNVGLGLVDIDVIKELGLHEVVVALVVFGSETEIFVEVEALAILEGDFASLVGFSEQLVHLHRGGAGGQAEDGFGVGLHLVDKDFGGELATFIRILNDRNFHVDLSFLEKRFNSVPWLLHCAERWPAFLHGRSRCVRPV